MPYSVPWNNATPVNGVDDNNTEDDVVRSVRQAIHERMDDIVVDWTADPVVLPQGIDALRLVKRYKYDADAAPGSRALNPAYALALLVVNYQGLTDVNSDIVISFNEFAEIYDLSSAVFGFLVGTEDAPINMPLWHQNNDDFVFPYLTNINVGARSVTYNMRREDGGLIGNGQFVSGDLLFFFQTVPT